MWTEMRMTQPLFCAPPKVWPFVRAFFVVFILPATTARLVHFSVSKTERGLRSTSGIISTIELPLVSACILYGVSLEYCHAVNYDTSSGLCEIVSTHGSLLEMVHEPSYIFVALDNRNDILDTGVRSACVQGPVQWKEQAKVNYIALGNEVYADEVTRKGYVCKATVYENELIGTTNPNNACIFYYKHLRGYSDLYRILVLDPDAGLSATWASYIIGDEVPKGAFAGGHLSTDTPLYVCRAPVKGVNYTGYYNPDTALAYIKGLVLHNATVDLLIFSPSGPTSGGPTADWPCPRYHVQVASLGFEYIPHYGATDFPSWSVNAGNRLLVGESAGAFSTPAKFRHINGKYYSVYGGRNGYRQWGHLLKTSLSYRWEPFEVGSEIPYNAFLGAYSIENDPVYIVMNPTYAYSIGTYNSKTNSTEIEHYGIKHPTSVQILTLPQPQGSSSWSDAGYNTYSGPITAIRIQLGVTVTGIKCRFGAQWSAGFWSDDHAVDVTQIDLKTNEYITGVKIGLGDTMDYIELFTNFDTYGSFGKASGGKNVSMFTRCGQIHHFSGYLRWDENELTNKTFSFAVHGESCTWGRDERYMRYLVNGKLFENGTVRCLLVKIIPWRQTAVLYLRTAKWQTIS